MGESDHQSAGSWAKRYYLASRVVIESVLRPYDLGSTQWYVMYQLANEGPTMQRDFVRMLQIERATFSGIVSALVRKGLIEQRPDEVDQRQKLLRITADGLALWKELPDPIALITQVAFEGVDEAELSLVTRVLKAATQRLNNHHLLKGIEK